MAERFSRPLSGLASTIADGIDRGLSPNDIAILAVKRGECAVDLKSECVSVPGVGTVASRADGDVEIDFFCTTVSLSYQAALKFAEVVEEAAGSAFDKADFSQRIKEGK